MLDDIQKEIASSGYSEQAAVGVIHLCFPSTPENSSEERIDEWCREHGYDYELIDRTDARKKSCQWIRFFCRR